MCRMLLKPCRDVNFIAHSATLWLPDVIVAMAITSHPVFFMSNVLLGFFFTVFVLFYFCWLWKCQLHDQLFKFFIITRLIFMHSLVLQFYFFFSYFVYIFKDRSYKFISRTIVETHCVCKGMGGYYMIRQIIYRWTFCTDVIPTCS